MIRISRKLQSRGIERFVTMDEGTIIVALPGAELTITASAGGPDDKPADFRMDFISIMRRGTPANTMDTIRQDDRRDCVRVIYQKKAKGAATS